MKIQYEQLCLQLEQQMLSKGYNPQTIRKSKSRWHGILSHPGNGIQGKLASAKRRLDAKLAKGSISPREYREIRLNIARIGGIAKGIFVDRYPKDFDASLCAYYRRIMDLVKSPRDWSEVVQRHVIYTARTLFRWLQERNVRSLRKLDVATLEEYLVFRAGKSFGIGMSDVRFSLKKLLDFLHQEQVTRGDLGKMLTMKMRLHKRILPAYSSAEIRQIVEGARKDTSRVAKRNLAIIQLARTTGLRASDIERIKLTDIDWRNGEIHLTQKKTGVPIVLPLMQEAGEAIKDYLLNERNGKGCEYVFLSFQHELIPARPVRVSAMYSHATSGMGFPRSKYDGKSFHAFRRTLGRDLVVAGIPPSTISQVLGHSTVDSVNPYINLDVTHLKDCALNFAHIKLSPRSIFHA